MTKLKKFISLLLVSFMLCSCGSSAALKKLENKDFGDEKFIIGSECLYMYLPRDASPKRLNTNYLEKQLSITMTMRKLNVVEHLVELCKK